ncbi:MAG: hypothetical protein Q8O97_01420 [bacterium]|nr:hypothetical protein [bacterium]
MRSIWITGVILIVALSLVVACTTSSSTSTPDPTPTVIETAPINFIREEVTARVDTYSPHVYPMQKRVGEVTSIAVTFTNTGKLPWQFLAGASVWNCKGEIIADYEKLVEQPLEVDKQITVRFDHTVIEGPQLIQFGLWKAKPYEVKNLIERAPSPPKVLLVGGDTAICK